MNHLGVSPVPTTSPRLWIFGYGSLCWRPGFEFERVFTGYVSGFSRRFWQGNTTHRGTTDKPGRVATLIDDKDGITWGCAFEISGDAALPYLTNRECKLGGYMTKFAMFHPKDTSLKSPTPSGAPFMVMLYIATPKNDLWLGEAPLDEMAEQIAECSGDSGHNVEYLIRLADFMKHHVPEAEDDHLFSLERLVREIVKQRNMCLKTLMGDGRGLRTFKSNSRNNSPEREPQNEIRTDSFQYTARVPEKNLRCLNI